MVSDKDGWERRSLVECCMYEVVSCCCVLHENVEGGGATLERS